MVIRQVGARTGVMLVALAVSVLVGTTPASAVSAQESAQELLADDGVSLLNSHVSGNQDPASTARQNVQDAAEGKAARTSPWSDLGVTEVSLSANMLAGAVRIGATFDYRVTSIAGGDHSSTSYHYQGTTFDVDVIDGQAVGAGNDKVDDFMRMCSELGAVEVLGPGDPGHDTHLHCAWDS